MLLLSNSVEFRPIKGKNMKYGLNVKKSPRFCKQILFKAQHQIWITLLYVFIGIFLEHYSGFGTLDSE